MASEINSARGPVYESTRLLLESSTTVLSNEFNLGTLSGVISDAHITNDKPPRARYFVRLDGDTTRMITIEPNELEGVPGDVAAVQEAQQQRTRQLLGDKSKLGKF